MEFLRYKEYTSDVRAGGEIPLRANCNGWSFTNVGADVATINGRQCLPPVGPGLSGETVGVSGNYGEVYEELTVQVTLATTVNPHLQLTQKVYSIKRIL
jgi:hypothetical protein